jgi:hypothetical protein
VANQASAPSEAGYSRAAAIIEARATTVETHGALTPGDEMIDEATRRWPWPSWPRGKSEANPAKPENDLRYVPLTHQAGQFALMGTRRT